MKILGIETSCDETAAAVVENGTMVLSNVIASQIPLHQKTGGIVPEVAAREHVIKIIPVIEKALRKAKIILSEIDVIAVTQGPGLVSSLVIGISTAKTIAMATNKPLIAVNHIAGHIYANWLQKDQKTVKKDRGRSVARNIIFPCVVLTASGGHNELVFMKEHVHFQSIGETLDDAAGEAFDKVARLLGLEYPGGPEIAKLAPGGDPKRFSFPRAYLHETSYDFSFSGLKTAVLNLVKKEHTANGKLSKKFIADCAAAFQEAVCEVLSDKLLRAAEEYKVRSILLAGGVSANIRLRNMIHQKIKDGYFYNYKAKNSPPKKMAITHKPAFFYPEDFSWCTDNAAMIAGAAYFFVNKKKTSKKSFMAINADPHLSLKT